MKIKQEENQSKNKEFQDLQANYLNISIVKEKQKIGQEWMKIVKILAS